MADKEINIDSVAGGSLLGYLGYRQTKKGLRQASGNVVAYHGTSKKRGESIRKTGLSPKYGGTKKSIFHGTALTRNKGLAFVSTHRKSTYAFSKIAEEVERTGKPFKTFPKDKLAENLSEVMEQNQRQRRVYMSGVAGDVIKFNIPRNRFDKAFSVDPENKRLPKIMQSMEAVSGRSATASKISRRRIAGALPRNVERSLKLRNFSRFVKNTPLKFAKGLGRAGIGAGLLGMAAHVLKPEAEKVAPKRAAPKRSKGAAKKSGKVKFIRKNGRVIPIRSK